MYRTNAIPVMQVEYSSTKENNNDFFTTVGGITISEVVETNESYIIKFNNNIVIEYKDKNTIDRIRFKLGTNPIGKRLRIGLFDNELDTGI